MLRGGCRVDSYPGAALSRATYAVYGAAAILSGAAFLWFSWRVYSLREGAKASKAAWRLFGFSIFYLFFLFSIVVIERLLSIAGVL